MKAAWSGHATVVQQLVAAKANLNARNKVRSRVLHHSAPTLSLAFLL
jgi:ankyrin repeat protein